MTTAYLIGPGVEKTQSVYRYMCQLASNKLELDRDGIPVPKHFQIVDAVVTEPTLAAITSLIEVVDWLSDYTLMAHWIPSDSAEF